MDQEQGRDLNVSGHGLVHGYGQGGGALETLIHLDTWDKLMMVAGAVAALCLTIFLIVCCVGDGCLIHDPINRHKSKFGLHQHLLSSSAPVCSNLQIQLSKSEFRNKAGDHVKTISLRA